MTILVFALAATSVVLTQSVNVNPELGAAPIELATPAKNQAKPLPNGCYRRPLEQGSGNVVVCPRGAL